MRIPGNVRIVVLGAGPTGLGAAHRLNELGFTEWMLYEAEESPGGLARSFCDRKGFTWDIGGHVQFSHYPYFDKLMDEMHEGFWLHHNREAWVWMYDRFVPYPLQNNIGMLPPKVTKDCLIGMLRAKDSQHESRIKNFRDWLSMSFGEGLCDHFMYPYNEKVWAYPPDQLTAHWVGDRVAKPDLERVIENVVLHKEDASWGPNNQFRFPKKGGTGAIWEQVAESLPSEKLHCGKEVVHVDTRRKMIHLSDGSRDTYDKLISTMPLDVLLARSDRSDLASAADTMRYSSSNIFGIGLRGAPPEHLKTKCWMYFPELDIPFYRVTVFSNYSPNNVPRQGSYWSLMAEVSESPHKRVDHDAVTEDVIRGLRKARLIENVSDIVSSWQFRAQHGYPTPFLGRDECVDPLLETLEDIDIYSRGRFGAWKYEVSNQDHSVMQGVECVNRILFDMPEITLNFPQIINGR